MGLFEGCVFNNVTTTLVDDFSGQLFLAASSSVSDCSSALGRDCEMNIYTDSPTATGSDTGFFSDFEGLTIASASPASAAATSVPTSAGNTLS